MNRNYGSLEWFSQEYEKVNDDPWGLSWRPSQSLRFRQTIATVARIQEPIHNVIDIGCGTGDFTSLLSQEIETPGFLLGTDFVSEAVERSRRKYPHLNFAIETISSVA